MQDIKKDRERFVAFAFASAEIFLEVNVSGKIHYEGGACSRITPSEETTLIGKRIHDLVVDEDMPFIDAFFPRIAEKKRLGPLPVRFKNTVGGQINLRVFALHMTDEAIYIALRSAPLANDYGMMQDHFDPNTGLINRTGFLELAGRTMRGTTLSGGDVKLTMAHIEGLEETRKKLGTKEVRSLINNIAAHFRSLSVDGTMAGQINETDFAILHHGQTSEQEIQTAVAKVDKAGLLKTSVSTVKTSDDAEMTEQQVIRTLSYVFTQFSKDPSKLNFESITEIYEDVAVKAKTRMTAIDHVIENRSFKLNYQPIYDLKTGEISHHEILSRFDDVIQGDTPFELIQFAEDIGLIENFDLAVFTKAIESIESYRRLDTKLRLAVNLSGRTLSSENHMEKLLKLLEENKHLCGQIMIELTESSAVSDVERAGRIFNRIKKIGFALSIDDFGKGAAGLNYLRAFDVDYVKIDGAFIRDLTREELRPGMLLTIIRLCKDLEVKTIAEHVEERFQADILEALGVDYAQGYYYSKPLPSPLVP
ncbi:EAL domain-containing protein [Temperatibacter marinus]|uniref:EAL domain-containing protein n=1 Tax=Temperatibacter marinus TaxID=1456591 RepID=A0AA52H9M6_9PROT|nr:EAL domain-containing protein [Temperatibacter marinus]WND03351.1 EAL domain-containing protein [Temperatibacter marinus]